MKPAYTQLEFELAKSREKLNLECEFCGEQFNSTKHKIKRVLEKKGDRNLNCCSRGCYEKSIDRNVSIKCSNCNKEICKTLHEVNGSKSGRCFCSRSCAAMYNNTHKTTGNRRSKLEAWLELELIKLYPNQNILFNKKDAIKSELDIHFISLKLAFELNGIFHYEPIFGENKLEQIQNNDNRKFQACLEKKIELCIIDTSQMKYFKESACKKYLDIIIKIVNEKSTRLDSNK